MKTIVLLLVALFMFSCGGEEVVVDSKEHIPGTPSVEKKKFASEDCYYTQWWVDGKFGSIGVVDTSYDSDAYLPGIQLKVAGRFQSDVPENVRVVIMGDGVLYRTTKKNGIYSATVNILKSDKIYLVDLYSYGFCPRTGFAMAVE